MRLNDKDSAATVSTLIGIRKTVTEKVVQVSLSDLSNQLMDSEGPIADRFEEVNEVIGQVPALTSQIDAVEDQVQQIANAVGGSGNNYYANKTALLADLVPINGFLAQTHSDPDFTVNEFFWVKSGGTGTGSWSQTTIPTQRYIDRVVSEIIAAAGLRNAVSAGNTDKYDVAQIVDAANKLIMGMSQRDGEIRIGPHIHKPVVSGSDVYLPMGFPCAISDGKIIVTHENGTSTVDGAPYVFSACGPGSRFVCGAWNKKGLDDVTAVQIDRNSEMFVPYGAALAMIVVLWGQSLAAGSNGVPPNWTNPHPDYILMPDVGAASDVRLGLTVSSGVADVLAPGAIAGLRAMESRSGVESVTYGQTPVESLCGAIHGDVVQRLGFAPRLIGMSVGVGGLGITDLKKGTQAYANFLTAMNDTKAAALGRAWRSYLPALDIRHGETDAASTTYAADMIALRNDVNADVKPIFGQKADILFIMAQSSSFANSSNGNAAKAMLDLHVTQPDGFVLSHPSYMLDFDINVIGDSGDNDEVHLSTLGYLLDGEYRYKARRATLFGRGRWEPLRPLSVVRSGANIDITFLVPVQPLVLDTTTISERSGTMKGFQYTDDGTPPAISSVTVTSPTTVRVVLASTPSGANKKIRYAMNGHDATSPRVASERPRGNLRDSDPWRARFDQSIVLPNWSVHFEIPVT